ncbi:MAG: NACHT domain-containing protein [Anaerolineae bacterium]|nr:NACHT domain-containing protein [Anaerolineae bacterium]
MSDDNQLIEGTSISPGLVSRLHRALLATGVFDSDGDMRAVFVDRRISRWRDEVPEGKNSASRVRKVISCLLPQASHAGENALVLLLHVLRDQMEPEDARYRTLATLADELERDLSQPTRMTSPLDRAVGPYPPPVDEVKHEFVNRKRELELLSAQNLKTSAPFLLLSAPAGYGKTHLLQHLVYLITGEEAAYAQWDCGYVDCAGCKEGSPIVYITQMLTGMVDVGPPETCTSLITDYVDELLDEEREVLLILDGLDALPDTVQRWLGTVLDELYYRTRYGHQVLAVIRIILAGHNVEPFWMTLQQTYTRLPAPQRITLAPFDEATVKDLVRQQVQMLNSPIAQEEELITEIASELHYVTGGHPRVICALLMELTGQEFRVGRVQRYLTRHRSEIVAQHFIPAAEGFLYEVAPELRGAIQVLSVFRRVNANTVQILVGSGVLPAATHEIELLGRMQATRLLEGPSIREPFYRNPFMRKVLVMAMAGRSAEAEAEFARLNRMSQDVYAGWVRNLGQGSSGYFKELQRVLSVVEWLFHALLDTELADAALRAQFRDFLELLTVPGQLPTVTDLILEEIRKDPEILYLLRQRARVMEDEAALRWLK